MDEDHWASHKRKAIEGAAEDGGKGKKKSKRNGVETGDLVVASSSSGEDDSKPSVEEAKPAAESSSGFGKY